MERNSDAKHNQCNDLPEGEFESGMNEAGNYNLPENKDKMFVKRSPFAHWEEQFPENREKEKGTKEEK